MEIQHIIIPHKTHGNNIRSVAAQGGKPADFFLGKHFPEVDVLRNNRIWAPLYDAIGCKTYKLPGRDLNSKTQFQFVEEEYMKADEYDILINNPVEFMMDRFLPRALGDMAETGSIRSRMAFLKGGMAQVMMGQVMKNRSLYLQEKLGMPQPMTGAFVAPFDVIADAMRGLRGILLDIYRQPDKVLEACDMIVHEIANFALSTADPLKRYPIFVPTHKACFLSPKQFETFYWPSFKKVLEILIEAGYTVRAYLEGDWGHHWHHMLELPKGKILCDIDNQGDIFKAMDVLGGHQCVAGGIPDSMFILGTPGEMRERVKLLCEKLGRNGGFIVNGGCNIPYDTKAENYRAMIDAIIEFGTYDKNYRAKPWNTQPGPVDVPALNKQRVVTPWEDKLAELGGVMGEEDLIKRPWEMFEKMGLP